ERERLRTRADTLQGTVGPRDGLRPHDERLEEAAAVAAGRQPRRRETIGEVPSGALPARGPGPTSLHVRRRQCIDVLGQLGGIGRSERRSRRGGKRAGENDEEERNEERATHQRQGAFVSNGNFSMTMLERSLGLNRVLASRIWIRTGFTAPVY